MGQLTLAEGLIVSIPHRVTLYPYSMGGPMLHCTHTTWVGQPALSVTFPIPYGPADISQKGDCSHTAWVGRCYIVPIPHGWANATLYPYRMGGPAQHCTHTAWVGQGELHTVAFTIYITCLFG